MAIPSGANTAVWLTDSGGTQRNLSTFCDSTDVSWDRDALETTTYSSSAAPARTRIPGLQDGSFSLGGKWDNGGTGTPDQWLSGLIGGTVTTTFVLALNGSASGRPYDTGAAICTSYAKSAPFDDVVTWSADFQVTAGITRGTF